MKPEKPTRITSLRGSIYKSNIEIQEILNDVVNLEIEISEPPIQKSDLKSLLEKYCLLIEYYHFSNNMAKSEFYSRR